ncbi:MAG: hypothetical protein ACE5F8_08240, partial [Woeseiaceae bacterium]
ACASRRCVFVMRALTLSLCILAIAALPVRAGEYLNTAAATDPAPRIPERTRTVKLGFDAGAQNASLTLVFGRARLNMGVANLLQVPVYEPPGGVYLDRDTLLTEALSGIEVDIGVELAASLTFTLVW